MILDATIFYKTSPLVFIPDKKYSNKYCETLDTALLAWTAENIGETTTWTFQQDGASIHSSEETRYFLSQRVVIVLTWSAK